MEKISLETLWIKWYNPIKWIVRKSRFLIRRLQVQVIWVDKDTTSLEIKDLEKKTKYTFRLTYTTGSGLDDVVLDRGIESAVVSKVITTAK